MAETLNQTSLRDIANAIVGQLNAHSVKPEALVSAIAPLAATAPTPAPVPVGAGGSDGLTGSFSIDFEYNTIPFSLHFAPPTAATPAYVFYLVSGTTNIAGFSYSPTTSAWYAEVEVPCGANGIKVGPLTIKKLSLQLQDGANPVNPFPTQQ